MTRWKILNVKTLKIDKLHNDPLQTEIKSPNDSQTDFIIEFDQMVLNITGSQGNRMKQLPKHAATTIHHTWNGIISLCQYLLVRSHKYILLGQFTTDPLEKEFSKLCQRSSGTYFKNVQRCIEKLYVKQTSLLLNQNVNIDTFDVNPGHQCTCCDYKFWKESTEIFDSLKNLQPSLSDEIKIALMFIAGYITKNDYQSREYETHF